MPVTFKASPVIARAVDSKSRCQDPEKLLEQVAATSLGTPRGQTLQSSFTAGNLVYGDRTDLESGEAMVDLLAMEVHPAPNGFFTSVYEAYCNHQNLVLRPDDVWMAILSQFSLYVNANAEALREKFVAHEGKKQLMVKRGGTRFTVDFGDVAVQMTEEMEKFIIDPDIRDWLLPSFSTTTANDTVVCAIMMMATLKEYFSYLCKMTCGIPEITLLGEKSDWEKLLAKAGKLPEFGEETGKWAALLEAVLRRMVAAFDDPASPEQTDFWERIVTPDAGMSGYTGVGGWQTAFCFFNSKGEPFPLHDGMECQNLVLDGQKFHFVNLEDVEDIPPGFAHVEMLLDDNGLLINSHMYAGLFGTRYFNRNGKGDHDSASPVAGWWIVEKNENEKTHKQIHDEEMAELLESFKRN